MSSDKDFFAEFSAAGNTFTGVPPVFIGKCSLIFNGFDCVVQLGRNVTFENVIIEMPEGGASLIVGDNVKLNGLIKIASNSSVQVGEDTVFDRRSELSAWEGADIKIGKSCVCSNVEISTSDRHSIIDLISGERVNPAESTVVEDSVWLSDGVLLQKGVTVGMGSIVGARSVVASSVPRYTSVSGAPAQITMRRISWQRNLVPLASLEASPMPQVLASKEEMAQMIKAGDSAGLIFDIDMFLKSTDMEFESLDGYAQFYYARCQYLCGNFSAARDILQVFVYQQPQHKVAIELLAKIPAGV